MIDFGVFSETVPDSAVNLIHTAEVDGDSYDALFETGRQKLKSLATNQIWRATKKEERLSFEPAHITTSQAAPLQ